MFLVCLWFFSNTIGFLLTDETGNQNITDCLPCSPGMYCSGYGNSFTSGECDAGYFCPEGLSSIMNLVYLSPGSNLSYGSHSAVYKYIYDMKQYFFKNDFLIGTQPYEASKFLWMRFLQILLKKLGLQIIVMYQWLKKFCC